MSKSTELQQLQIELRETRERLLDIKAENEEIAKYAKEYQNMRRNFDTVGVNVEDVRWLIDVVHLCGHTDGLPSANRMQLLQQIAKSADAAS